MVRVENLSKRYGRHWALDNVSFEVPDGCVYGFVGPNGAGKTTTLKILATLLEPTSGRAWVGGAEVTTSPYAVRRKIGYMPDFFGVYDDLRVLEYLEFYASAYDIDLSRKEQLFQDLLALVDLEDKADAYVDTLSRGMKQRLCLARCLVHDPDLLILDEPASGLDPRARVEMRGLLKELGKMGKTVIISSHILTELSEICTDIGIIHNGRLVYSGPVADAMNRMTRGRDLEIACLGPIAPACAFLAAYQGVRQVKTIGDQLLQVAFEGDREAQSRLVADLVGAGIAITSFREVGGNLEDVFMQLTAEVAGR
ncbi:MAG: ABC transporter ATP-binding protein [Bacillota bacterium]